MITTETAAANNPVREPVSTMAPTATAALIADSNHLPRNTKPHATTAGSDVPSSAPTKAGFPMVAYILIRPLTPECCPKIVNRSHADRNWAIVRSATTTTAAPIANSNRCKLLCKDSRTLQSKRNPLTNQTTLLAHMYRQDERVAEAEVASRNTSTAHQKLRCGPTQPSRTSFDARNHPPSTDAENTRTNVFGAENGAATQGANANTTAIGRACTHPDAQVRTHVAIPREFSSRIPESKSDDSHRRFSQNEPSYSGFRLKYINGAWNLPKFEECLQRLEQIVGELEKGEIPLERALGLFEEGIQLSNSCRQELEEAEGKVEVLLSRGGKVQTEPFDSAQAESDK